MRQQHKPANGKGFESAVAYTVAKQLGFAPADVNWVVEPFDSSYAPGPNPFDFDINEISIGAARSKVVDFSPSITKTRSRSSSRPDRRWRMRRAWRR